MTASMWATPSPMNQSSAAVSASIPLSEEDAATVFGQRTESGTEVDIESERLPNAVMHLAEYYIALKAVSSGDQSKVVLLDRPLAGDVAHLVWSTRDLVQDHLSVLEGMETPFGSVTNFDLELARLLVANPELKIPSPRSQLLKFAAIASLFGGEELTLAQMLDEAGLRPVAPPTSSARTSGSSTRPTTSSRRAPTAKTGSSSSGRGVKDYLERVVGAALAVADHVFNPKSEHPLRIKAGQTTRSGG